MHSVIEKWIYINCIAVKCVHYVIDKWIYINCIAVHCVIEKWIYINCISVLYSIVLCRTVLYSIALYCTDDKFGGKMWSEKVSSVNRTKNLWGKVETGANNQWEKVKSDTNKQRERKLRDY